MASIEQLRELAERLVKATGPDRELDFAIAMAFGWTRRRYSQMSDCYGWRDENGKQCSQEFVPYFSASIDSALALVERLLPEIQWDVRKFGSDGARYEAWVQSYSVEFRMAVAPTAPLAILRAMVKAMIAEAA